MMLALLSSVALLVPQPQDAAPPNPLAVSEPEAEVRLSLQQALDMALQRDLGLQMEELSAEVARFNYEGSWGAFDPVFNAQASVTDTDFEIQSSIFGSQEVNETTVFGEAGVLFPVRTGGSFEVKANSSNKETNEPFQGLSRSTTDNIELSFNQPLLRGAGSSYAESTQREADLEFRRQLESLDVSRQALLANVENAYWDLVSALRQVAVAEESLSVSREQLEQNRRRLEAGVGTQVEVLQSEADEAIKVEQHLLRDVELSDAQDMLKGFLQPGTDSLAWSAQIVPITPLPEVDLSGVPEWRAAVVTALEHRPDLRRDRVQIDIAEEQLTRARSERKARLDLNLSTRGYGFDSSSSAALSSAAEFEFPTHVAALTFSLPIGNRSASSAERSARASLRSARLAYDAQESKVVEEVRGAVRRINYAAEAIAATSKSADLAQEQLQAEQARYREGLSTNFQVLQFAEQLSTAQFNLTQAQTLFAKARVTLDQHLGTLGNDLP